MQNSCSIARTGIFLIAHAPLASALKTCAHHILPDIATCITAYDVKAEDPIENALKNCIELSNNLCGSQIIIMTDVIGASPYRLSMQALTHLKSLTETYRPAHVVTGVNIPMLLRALTYHYKDIDELIELVVEGGARGITSTKNDSLAF